MANSVTQAQLEQLVDDSEYQEAIFWDKEIVGSYKLPSGFTVLGRSACVDPKNFDLEIGRKLVRDDVIRQLWLLEGYLLQNRLHDQGVL